MATAYRIPAAVAVVSDPQILGGMPVVSGTRVPAATILAYLDAGASLAEIVADYPYLPLGFLDAVMDWAEANGRPRR